MKTLFRRTLPLVILLAAACKVDPATRPVSKASSPKPTPTPVTSPQSVAARVLARGENSRTLTGTVVVDAGYLVAKGGGTLLTVDGQQVVGAGHLITNDGGSIISNDGGSIISNDGGSIISNDGGSIVASGGGNIVASGGGNIVASGGGNLITNDGGSLITNDGGSLLADDGTTLLANGIVASGGGNIVASGGGNYRLAAAAAPPPGTQLPAAGMVISVVSLDTHKYVPIGRNASGKPVYSVYSNAKGAYTIYPEANPDDNLLVVTSPPGSRDARGALNVLGPAHSEEAVQLARETDLASKFLRVAFAAQIKALFLVPTMPGVPRCNPSEAQDKLIQLLTPEYVLRLQKLAYDGRAYALDGPTIDRLALETVDMLLQRADIPNTMTLPNLTRVVIPDEAKGLQPEPVMRVLTEVLHLGEQYGPAAAKADPQAFACDGPNHAALERVCGLIARYHLAPPRIDAPYGLADFAVNQMLWTGDHAAVDGMGDLLTVAGVPQPLRQQFRLIGVVTGLEFSLAARAADEEFKQRFADKVATFRVADPSKVPTPSPIPSGSCVPDLF